MLEYIKRVSIAVSFITEKISQRENILKQKMKDLSLDLIILAQKFRNEDYRVEDLVELESKIILLIDIIDFAKINNFISIMNANVFTDSQIAFLKHIYNLIDQKNNFVEAFVDLKKVDEILARKTGKENAQTKYSLGPISNERDFVSVPERKTEFFSNYEDMSSQEKKEVKTSKENEFKVEDNHNKKILEEKIITPQYSLEKALSVPVGSVESVEKEIATRRSRILMALSGGGGSIKEIRQKMKDVSEKTLQRDLLELMRDRKVIMLGKKRWAKYYLK